MTSDSDLSSILGMSNLDLASDNPLKEPARHTDENDDLKARIDDLEGKWAQFEFVMIESSRRSELIETTNSYVEDLKKEINSLKWLRWFLIGAVLLYIIFINSLLVSLIFYHPFLFFFLGSYEKAAFIILTLSTTAVLLGRVVSGVFKTYGERNKEEYIPPHMQQIIDVINTTKTQ